ncbi:MAG: CocE/NonD family hydrolase [Alphaproteobacteria bacterium]
MFKIGKFAMALFAASALASCGVSGFLGSEPKGGSQAAYEGNVMARDGTPLYTLVYLPSGPGPHPALVMRSPYDIPSDPPGGISAEVDDDDTAAAVSAWKPVLDRGYAVVMQNTRGRHRSGGEDSLFLTDREDGYDLAAWVTAQPWSDGRFAVVGDSADGFSGLLMAAARPPGLKGVFVQASCGSLLTDGVIRRTGAMQVETLVPWFLAQAEDAGPDHRKLLGSAGSGDLAVRAERMAERLARQLRPKPEEWLPRPLAGHPEISALLPKWATFIGESGYAERAAYLDAIADIEVPVFHVGLWQDVFIDCTIEGFSRLHRRRGDQRLLVFEGTHYDIDKPSTWGRSPMLDWLDEVVRGRAPDRPADASVAFAVEGGGQVMRTATSWPPLASVQTLYLQPGGNLTVTPPKDAFALGTYEADATRPLLTQGGRNLVVEAGALLQDEPGRSSDVIAFRATPVAADTILAGPVTLTATLTSTAADADLAARLVAVSPDGERQLIADGLARARYRAGRAKPSALTPGVPVAVRVEIGHVARRLPAGHRLELYLSGSNFPRWDTNPNRDVDPVLATGSTPARVSLQTDPAEPARLEYGVLAGP